MERSRSARLHRWFLLAVALKGLDGLLEMAGAVLLLATRPGATSRLLRLLTKHELSEDPHDWVATHLLHAGHQLGQHRTFAAAYLLGHGALKLFLVGGMLRRQAWTYPTAMIVLALFILYQGYRFALRPSLALAALSVIDAGIVVLIGLELRNQRRTGRGP